MEILAVLFSILLLGLFLVVAVPVILAGLVLGSVLYVLAQLLVLPFRLMGWTVALGAGVILIFAKLALIFLLGLVCIAALVVGFLPLLPVFLICLGIWLVLRSGRRQHRAVTT